MQKKVHMHLIIVLARLLDLAITNDQLQEPKNDQLQEPNNYLPDDICSRINFGH